MMAAKLEGGGKLQPVIKNQTLLKNIDSRSLYSKIVDFFFFTGVITRYGF
jgi:hypothetical protein